MSDLDRAKNQAQRELWDVINKMALRRVAGTLDLQSWIASLDHTRMTLSETLRRAEARDAEHTDQS